MCVNQQPVVVMQQNTVILSLETYNELITLKNAIKQSIRVRKAFGGGSIEVLVDPRLFKDQIEAEAAPFLDDFTLRHYVDWYEFSSTIGDLKSDV